MMKVLRVLISPISIAIAAAVMPFCIVVTVAGYGGGHLYQDKCPFDVMQVIFSKDERCCVKDDVICWCDPNYMTFCRPGDQVYTTASNLCSYRVRTTAPNQPCSVSCTDTCQSP